MGIFNKLFGGSTQKSFSTNDSWSNNQAYPYVSQAFGEKGGQAYQNTTNTLMDQLLGGFDAYKTRGGYDFALEQGRNKILGGLAGKGVLQSGAALKGLADYGNNLSNQYYTQYLDKLFGLGSLGGQGGQLAVGAGGTARSTGTSSGVGSNSPGVGGFLGSLLGSVAASDRRLKKDIFEIGVLPDGLKLYNFNYIWGENATGVMADEVAVLRPEALGPVVGGYATVDYSKL